MARLWGLRTQGASPEEKPWWARKSTTPRAMSTMTLKALMDQLKQMRPDLPFSSRLGSHDPREVALRRVSEQGARGGQPPVRPEWMGREEAGGRFPTRPGRGVMGGFSQYPTPGPGTPGSWEEQAIRQKQLKDYYDQLDAYLGLPPGTSWGKYQMRQGIA